MSELNRIPQTLPPHEVISKLFHIVDAFEEHLIHEESLMENYTLQDLRAVNAKQDALNEEYFSCLNMIESEDILLRLSKEDVAIVRNKIANLTTHLQCSREKIAQLCEENQTSLRIFQQSQQKTSAYYNRSGFREAVPVSTWRESI